MAKPGGMKRRGGRSTRRSLHLQMRRRPPCTTSNSRGRTQMVGGACRRRRKRRARHSLVEPLPGPLGHQTSASPRRLTPKLTSQALMRACPRPVAPPPFAPRPSHLAVLRIRSASLFGRRGCRLPRPSKDRPSWESLPRSCAGRNCRRLLTFSGEPLQPTPFNERGGTGRTNHARGTFRRYRRSSEVERRRRPAQMASGSCPPRPWQNLVLPRRVSLLLVQAATI